MLGALPEEKETRGASSYETVVATFIALLAVSVASYTAYKGETGVASKHLTLAVRNLKR